MCHQFVCDDPKVIEIKVNAKGKVDLENGTEKKLDKFAIGALTGFEMALDALDIATNGAFKSFQRHDKVNIECTGVQEALPGQSPMPEFKVIVERR